MLRKAFEKEENMLRDTFCCGLTELAGHNENIVVLDADLGKANGTLPLQSRFPDRAFDVGVAEQNMASVAAGLASYGFIPFITSFTAFATRRIADQAAISISYARQNVKIVGTDPSLTSEYNGGTHMSMEDVGIMRSIPGIMVVEPIDPVQFRAMIPAIVAYEGPVYLRLNRKVAADVFPEDYQFNLLKADVLREGSDVTIATSGIMVVESLDAAELLAAEGIEAEVISFHTLKPLDAETLLASARKTGCVVTAENHSVVNGLGSAAAEIICRDCPVPLHMIGVPDRFGLVGQLEELKQRFGMKATDIVSKAKEVIAMK